MDERFLRFQHREGPAFTNVNGDEVTAPSAMVGDPPPDEVLVVPAAVAPAGMHAHTFRCATITDDRSRWVADDLPEVELVLVSGSPLAPDGPSLELVLAPRSIGPAARR